MPTKEKLKKLKGLYGDLSFTSAEAAKNFLIAEWRCEKLRSRGEKFLFSCLNDAALCRALVGGPR